MGNKLLIVDDESDILEFAANFFRKRKIDVLTASTGEEAIKKVVAEHPKVVLLDIKMVGMDGIETLRRIRELYKHIKIIMVTGRNDEQAKMKTEEYGANGYINKPLELDQLEKVVLKILEKDN